MIERAIRIAVCGTGECEEPLTGLAERVGRNIAEAGAILLCGGLGGVMEAASRGAAEAGGLTVGILPGCDAHEANPHVAVPLPTGMGEMRNALLIRMADAVIGVGGEWGTLSEIALAMKIGKPVVLLHPSLAAGLNLPQVGTAEEAVDAALARARGEPFPGAPVGAGASSAATVEQRGDGA